MTKNIRVTWNDLQPGDKVHLKGSDNVYTFVRKIGHAGSFVVTTPGVSYLEVLQPMFLYATRPAPRKRVHRPSDVGEYWLYTRDGWRKLFVTYTFGSGICFQYHDCWYITWGDVLKAARPSTMLTAEEYYTRKAKGEL
ncbi:hypothetical protein [Bifidobacterium myosotis]|uniref:Uncharacterized protein n=1 Tax=Bifidobacterium myosotis TaxID=1630166 RepID=A0A5M9ZIP7_9BIFI|nr:hypothetical protein [Bifidobacterium myosotis]KAA8827223.1 hypothetical protein EMO91_09230 [Bifidobacterium myosotis]